MAAILDPLPTVDLNPFKLDSLLALAPHLPLLEQPKDRRSHAAVNVMTVGATVACLLPIMGVPGTGSEVMRRIAAPMIGGMIILSRTRSTAPSIKASYKSLVECPGRHEPRCLKRWLKPFALLTTHRHQMFETPQAIRLIGEGSRSAVGMVEEIASAIREQATAMNNIAPQVERIAQMSEESSAAAGNSADTAQNLDQIANKLQHIVNTYRL